MSDDYARVQGYYAYDYQRPALTVDIVAIYESSALLITRKFDPFEGCLALPGGFVDPADQDAQAAAAREFSEECSLMCSPDRFKPLPARTNRNRDPRGWTISIPHRINLTKNEFEYAKAGDDAATLVRANLLWDDIGEMAFDHLEIIKEALLVRFR